MQISTKSKRFVFLVVSAMAFFLIFAVWRNNALPLIDASAVMDSSSGALYQQSKAEISEFQKKEKGGNDAIKGHPRVDFVGPFLPVDEPKRTLKTTIKQEVTADTVVENVEGGMGEIPDVRNGIEYDPEKNTNVPHNRGGNVKASGEIPPTNIPSPATVSPSVHDDKEPVTSLPPLPTFYPSKDLFVRAVYFDDRPRDGHQNTSVFLVVCIRNITDNKLIIGCQVDGRQANKFSVKLIGETPLWRYFYDKINHEEVLVHCYDLPAKNGSNGYILYKKSRDSNTVIAASERRLVIPAPRIKPSSAEGVKYNMTIVTCAKVFEEPPWLEKWLIYQRTLGVDHVHLDVEDSFIKRRKGLSRPFIKRAMEEGFLTVDVWNRYLGVWEIWYHNQGLIYEDCPYRFRGTYDYIIMLDTDDFFTLRRPDQLKLHYYINTFCTGKGVGSCKFKWVEYFPDVFGFSNVSTADGNITRGLKNYSHFNQGNPKSLHRTTVLIDTATHYAHLMMPGYRIAEVSLSVAYVAHVRKNNKLPEKGKLVIGLPNTCSEHTLSVLLLTCSMYLVFMITRVKKIINILL